MGWTHFPKGVTSMGVPLPSNFFPQQGGKVKFVDGTNGSDVFSGDTPKKAYATIQKAVTEAKAGGIVYVFPKNMGVDGDPGSYAETVIVPATHDRLAIIGISHGRTQCGLPQIKKGSGSTALLTLRAQGVLVMNMGFNGAGSTGGGILLDSDGATKDAAGATILNCHFKNCKCHATNGSLGGAVYWGSNGACWQVLIKGNRFYKNVADIVLVGTGVSVPQDVVIEDNIFSGPAASVDINLFLKGGGSGMDGVIIRNNSFTCFPALGGGTNTKSLDLTGCIGSLVGNTFSSSAKTFGAAGNNLVPTTVLMADNYQECAAGAAGEIGRT